MTNSQILDVLKRIEINTHITKNLLCEGKVIIADRKNDAVIDQLSLLINRLSKCVSQQEAEADGPIPAATETTQIKS